MNRCLRITTVVLGAIACLSLACSSKLPPVVPAAGKMVRANGKPVTGANVMFWPMENGKSFPTIPYSLTDSEGRFDVIMLNNERGLPPGKYRVTVTVIKGTGSDPVPLQYTQPDNTPWEVIVPAAGKTDILLQVKHE